MADFRYYRAWVEGDVHKGYGVSFPDFPGCVSAGDTFEDALRNGTEALALHVAGMVEDGDPIPAATRPNDPLPDWLDGVPGRVAYVPAEVPAPKFVRLNISLDENLVRTIDRAATSAGNTRSGWLADAARRALEEAE